MGVTRERVCLVEGCGQPLRQYGTGGMTCAHGHHFTLDQVTRHAATGHRAARRRVVVRPWVPGVIVGAVGLVLAVVDLLLIVLPH